MARSFEFLEENYAPSRVCRKEITLGVWSDFTVLSLIMVEPSFILRRRRCQNGVDNLSHSDVPHSLVSGRVPRRITLKTHHSASQIV